jgi:aminoglycoside 3-N-acetyltransferase
MKEINLFTDKQNKWITNHDILKKLEKVGANNCNILYIHTSISFGAPNPALGKNELLEIILETFSELKVPTICFPTFTFSFCNGKEFDVTQSKSKMGALNEHARKRPGTIRSVDPLMSVALIGTDKDLATGIGHNSVGKNSTFDKLHYRDKVKFLFFGTKIGDCFTYMHYMEDFLKVPYRYDKNFTGKIITPEKTYEDTYTLFVRYKNIFPGKGSYVYEDQMIAKGIAKKELCGDTFIISVDEPPAFEAYADLIKKEPDYFIDPKSVHDFDKTFFVKDMVAL